MLYKIHELQHMALSPYRAWLHASRTALAPWRGLPMVRPFAAGLEVAERLTRRYGKPEFGLTHATVAGESVRVREDVIDETPFCSLLHFVKEGVKDQPKVLLVAPLSGHYATLLRGTVEAMLPDHDVYITDWTDARDVPLDAGGFHLDDYIELMMRHLTLLGSDAHVIAVCQPSVPVLAAVALLCEDGAVRPKSMTSMGGPVDTRKAPTAVIASATEHSIDWFRGHSIHAVTRPYQGFGRTRYQGFLQLPGSLGRNIARHANSHTSLSVHLV